jgi:hypothetical protein
MMTYREPRPGAAREGEALVSTDGQGGYVVDGVNVESIRVFSNGYTGLVLVDNKTTYVLTSDFAPLRGRREGAE